MTPKSGAVSTLEERIAKRWILDMQTVRAVVGLPPF